MICPHCGSKNTHKRGFSHAGTPQFHCGSCNKRFSITTQPEEDTSTKDKIKNLITDKRYTINEISEIIRVNPSTVSECIARLRSERYNIIEQDGVYELSSIIQQGGKSSINLSHLCNKTYKIGAIGDLHLCSKYERLDALNTFYDICVKDGIKEIYIAGNWVDGEAVFNKYDLIRNGITSQIEYFCEMLPKRDGIMNYFIAGDDHEGWWQQREHIIIGEYAQMLAENKFNRNDMKYIGYMESDIELKGKNGSAIMRVSHPGGGSSYAQSYTAQKIIESYTGGEKPQILLIGHYHKFEYTFARNVHAVQCGTFQDQTPFMRKKRLAAHVGGCILEITQAEDGSISRFKVEFIPFFDREFYNKWEYKN